MRIFPTGVPPFPSISQNKAQTYKPIARDTVTFGAIVKVKSPDDVVTLSKAAFEQLSQALQEDAIEITEGPKGFRDQSGVYYLMSFNGLNKTWQLELRE